MLLGIITFIAFIYVWWILGDFDEAYEIKRRNTD